MRVYVTTTVVMVTFHSIETSLSQGVQYFVFVVCLIPSKRCKQEEHFKSGGGGGGGGWGGV